MRLPHTLAAIFALALLPDAQTLTYRVCGTGDQEVPAVVTPGTLDATVQVNTSTGVAVFTGTYQTLMGAQTLAHLHGPAAIGANGPIVFHLSAPSSPRLPPGPT